MYYTSKFSYVNKLLDTVLLGLPESSGSLLPNYAASFQLFLSLFLPSEQKGQREPKKRVLEATNSNIFIFTRRQKTENGQSV